MKLLLVLLVVCAAVTAAPSTSGKKDIFDLTGLELNPDSDESRNILVNALVRQLIAFLRRIIKNGSDLFGIPPLDPLELESFNLNIPAGLINLNLQLENVHATGFGGFEVVKSDLNLRTMTFDLDIAFPTILASCELYDLIGDLFTAVPLYGKGRAVFRIDGFRFQARLLIKQSEDEQSVILEGIQDASFVLPGLKSEITGAIGGGEIDKIVNAIAEDVFVSYVNRFQGVIAAGASSVIVEVLNPILEQLNTWSYIALLIPRN